jgi:hypothetical protein
METMVTQTRLIVTLQYIAYLFLVVIITLQQRRSDRGLIHPRSKVCPSLT